MKNFLLAACVGISASSVAQPQPLFRPVDIHYDTRTVIIPEGFKYAVLYSEYDTVVTNAGVKAPGKGSQDMIVYIPIDSSSEHGYLYVNQEEHIPNKLLGDGGGGTVFEVRKKRGQWVVIGDKHAVDFSNVGETFRNCGGTITPRGTILTTEEEFPQSNAEIYSRFGITDTSDYRGKKKYLNYGWMVEVDPKTHKAIQKIKEFGRYPHEDAQCMPDGKTIYLTSDNVPAIVFKYICKEPGVYTGGQLYAYQQSADAQGGSWIALPMQEDSLMNIIDVAVRRHATMLNSTEWIEAIGDKLYISESGTNHFSFDREIAMGGRPAHHLDQLCHTTDHNYEDHYGRIVELDLRTNKMRSYLNGGVSKVNSRFCFSSPDAMTSATIRGKKYLIISEDTDGDKNGSASAEVSAKHEVYNEVYFLDMSIQNPTLEDLKRFMVGPEGCETSGNMFTPDGRNYFVSIQHPTTSNPPPFNKTTVIAITGF